MKEITPHPGRTVEKWNNRNYDSIIKKSLPPRIIKDLKNFRDIKCPEMMEGQSLYIYGANRTGKTLVAASLLMEQFKKNYLLAETYNSYFVKMPDLLEEIKQSFGRYNEADVLERYINCELLVLDDFAITKPTDWTYQTLYRLIDTRYENIKPIVFTANISLDELETLYGDTRLTSRIKRMGNIIHKKPFIV